MSHFCLTGTYIYVGREENTPLRVFVAVQSSTANSHTSVTFCQTWSNLPSFMTTSEVDQFAEYQNLRNGQELRPLSVSKKFLLSRSKRPQSTSASPAQNDYYPNRTSRCSVKSSQFSIAYTSTPACKSNASFESNCVPHRHHQTKKALRISSHHPFCRQASIKAPWSQIHFYTLPTLWCRVSSLIRDSQHHQGSTRMGNNTAHSLSATRNKTCVR